jgi:transposase
MAFDGLAALCRQKFEQDSMSGCAFIFRNRRRTSIKILFYDGQGFWLCQKRFSQGHMQHVTHVAAEGHLP